MTVLSITTTALSPGVIFIPPFVVSKTIAVSPIIISSAAIAVGIPHSPEPSPSDIHDCPVTPSEVMPNSTLLDESIPSSTRSVRLESIC